MAGLLSPLAARPGKRHWLSRSGLAPGRTRDQRGPARGRGPRGGSRPSSPRPWSHRTRRSARARGAPWCQRAPAHRRDHVSRHTVPRSLRSEDTDMPHSPISAPSRPANFTRQLSSRRQPKPCVQRSRGPIRVLRPPRAPDPDPGGSRRLARLPGPRTDGMCATVKGMGCMAGTHER